MIVIIESIITTEYSLTVSVQELHTRLVGDAVLGIYSGNTDELIRKIHIGIWYN